MQKLLLVHDTELRELLPSMLDGELQRDEAAAICIDDRAKKTLSAIATRRGNERLCVRDLFGF
jgi:hypothetical protein